MPTCTGFSPTTAVMRQVQWGSAWLALFFQQQRQTLQTASQGQAPAVLELLATLLGWPRASAAQCPARPCRGQYHRPCWRVRAHRGGDEYGWQGTDIRLAPGVAGRGGLHVIVTEGHKTRRIDRQLFGRCGRQGDPRSHELFVSFEDEIITMYAGRLWCWLGMAAVRSIPYAHRIGAYVWRRAQRRAERRRLAYGATCSRWTSIWRPPWRFQGASNDRECEISGD